MIIKSVDILFIFACGVLIILKALKKISPLSLTFHPLGVGRKGP